MKYIHYFLFLTAVFGQVQERIEGGTPPPSPFAYPWLVAIIGKGNYMCAGSLIAPNKVLTAAHCTEIPKLETSVYSVSVHRYDLTKTDEEEEGATYKVLDVTIHPDFELKPILVYDAAVWTLDVPADDEFTSNIKFPVLSDSDDLNLQDNEKFIAAGWGKTENNELSPVLLTIEIPLIPDESCKEYYPGFNLTSIMCAGEISGEHDVSSGDSGGPLFKLDNETVTIVGILSFKNGSESAAMANGYARLNTVYDFINNI